MPQPYLSIVIPNYNEMANLKAGAIEKVAKYLKTAKFTWEVIINEDGSTDGSREYLNEFVKKHPGFNIILNSHAGKAGGLKAGIEKAKGKYILTTDMDQSAPLKEVEKFIPYFEEGYKAVIGSRNPKRKSSFIRQFLSIGFFTVRRFLLLRDIKDTQCGFKAYESKLIKEVFPKLSNFKSQKVAKGWKVSAFDVELLFLISKRGEKIKEVIVDWQDEDVSTSKPRNFLTESIDMLKQILKVKLTDLQGGYEA